MSQLARSRSDTPHSLSSGVVSGDIKYGTA